MKLIQNILIASASICALVSCSKNEAPAPIFPIPNANQIEWQQMETYAFVHFGLNTFNDLEWGFGDTPASTFDPTNLDPDQWARIIKAAGFKGIILTAKHHDGFCLWPSKYTEYSVKNSPWKGGKGDMVRELIDACKRNNLRFGLYLSPWDRNHADYGTPAYTEYFQNQIKELIEEYCDSTDLFEYWFDGANGGDGYYGGAREKRSIDATTYYDYSRAVATIHGRHPAAMIFGGTEPSIRWVGNEEGWAGETNWSPFTEGGHYTEAQWGMPDGAMWLPAECDVSIRPGWFYHPREDHQVRSLSHLVDLYYMSVGRNANLLMNFPVGLDGLIHPIDSARIMEWRHTLDEQLAVNLVKTKGVTASSSSDRGRGYKASRAIDGNWDSYWATDDSVSTGEITIKLKEPQNINRIVLQEYIPLGQRVASFAVDYLDSANRWVPIATRDTMSTIGYKRIIRFETALASSVRVKFLESRGPLTINNIELYMAPALMTEPTIMRSGDGMVKLSGALGAELRYTTDGSEPTVESRLYTELFMLAKGHVRAIAVDPTYGKKSGVSARDFDIVTTQFSVIAPVVSAGPVGGTKDGKRSSAAAAFDGDVYTAYYLPEKSNELCVDLGAEYEILGVTYAPDPNRWGSGPISKYKIYVDNVEVASGEFSNIKANPIEQRIIFDKPLRGKRLRLVVEATADGAARASVAEFAPITK